MYNGLLFKIILVKYAPPVKELGDAKNNFEKSKSIVGSMIFSITYWNKRKINY
jgi:hypothetical protein